jgi:4-cresol dehydrogenase (hydroxylating)
VARIRVPDISERTRELACRDFARALGDDAVLTGAEALSEFRDPFQPPSWDDYTASAVVAPKTVEEVQAVVAIANEHRLPLWTAGRRG